MTMTIDYRDLTDDEFELLREYASEHGKDWKHRLMEDWYHARLTGTLHALRNDPNWSHRGLEAFNVDANVLHTVPAYEAPQWIRDAEGHPTGLANEAALKWSGKDAPNPIGSEIVVTMNNLGPATVLGYFIEGNWLGMQVKLHAAPEWHRKQRLGNPIAYVFGADLQD